MSRCSVCKIDLGFFGKYRCKDHTDLHYGDEVIIVDGFYKGQYGKIIGANEIGDSTYYDIQLKDGNIIPNEAWGSIENVKWK
jgi:hypothetical protein